jgi:hypothetical protein
VRALEMLHERLAGHLSFVHRSRWDAVWRVVQALIIGKKLWLTALGRALPTTAFPKHAIKAVDRLLGNPRLYRERFAIAAAASSMILRRACRPIVLIDTAEIRHKVIVLTASLAHDGRSFPIWSTTVRGLRASGKDSRRFLEELAQVIPGSCRPILVTDAGFDSEWLAEIDRRGWDYVCRVRGQVKLLRGKVWVGCEHLHRLARKRASNLGRMVFPKTRGAREARRLVLSKIPTCRHRQVVTRTGPSRDTNYKEYRRNAYEPLLLTTSLTCRPSHVVEIYRLRMQIEESFRDLKCHRWGWSLRHCRSRSQERIEILLLIASIAVIIQQLIGIAGELQNLQHRHQANTLRKRRVLSVFLLGSILLSGMDQRLVTLTSLRQAVRGLRKTIATLARLQT